MVCTTKLIGSGEAMIDDMKSLHAEAEELRKRKADLRERAKASIGEHKTAISELESAIVSLEDGPAKGPSLLSRVRAALLSLSSLKVSWGVVVLALALAGYIGWKEGWIPLPGPTPGPDPIPAPIPAEGLRVGIIYESADKARYTPKQLAVMASAELREYMRAKTVEYRIIDKDTPITDSPLWKAVLDRPRTDLPWLVISNGKTGFEGPLPKDMTPEQAKALIAKYEVK